MKYLFLLFYCLLYLNASSQQVFIKDIMVVGNKMTKTKILLRELTFHKGDSIDVNNIEAIFSKNSRYLLGTFLASSCDFEYENLPSDNIIIKMKITEAWYIYPFPIFELADRNFNVWWKDYNHDFSRTNFGIQIKHYNTTGRKDQLKMTGQHGYTQKLELDYKIPGINKHKTLGFFFNLYYKRSKETPYTTLKNKLQFTKENQYTNQSFRAFLGISLRPKLRTTHSFRLLFRNNKIGNAISNDLNPDYFLNREANQKYFSFQYKFVFDSRDFEPYPTKGILVQSINTKKGFGVFDNLNYFNSENSFLGYIAFNKKISLASFAKINLRWSKNKLPYNQIQALGYRNNQLHGYDYYVIDGEHFAFLKTSLRYKFINTKINWNKLMPISSFKIMPLEIFATLNNDFGYVYTKYYSNLGDLTNKPIWGKGLGIDIIFYTTFVLRIDYSINNNNEKGFFFHFNPYF